MLLWFNMSCMSEVNQKYPTTLGRLAVSLVCYSELGSAPCCAGIQIAHKTKRLGQNLSVVSLVKLHLWPASAVSRGCSCWLFCVKENNFILIKKSFCMQMFIHVFEWVLLKMYWTEWSKNIRAGLSYFDTCRTESVSNTKEPVKCKQSLVSENNYNYKTPVRFFSIMSISQAQATNIPSYSNLSASM